MKILNVIIIAVLVILFLPLIVYNLPFIVGGNGAFIVMSGSMEPTIHTGDVIITSSIKPENLQQNDIITFKGENSFATHRIVEINKEDLTFKTKGDASEDADTSLLNVDQIRGKYFFSIPYYGYILFYLGNWIIVGMIIIPTILLLYDMLKNKK